MTNNGFERFSLERRSPHGSHVEAKAEGAELGSYCFLFPRIGSRDCTLKQTLTPFLLQKVTVRHDGAGNVNKERACFAVTAIVVCTFAVVLAVPQRSGVVPVVWGQPGVSSVSPFAESDQRKVPLPIQQLTRHQGLCSQAMSWCQFMTSREKKKSRRWQPVTEQRLRQNKLPRERLER